MGIANFAAQMNPDIAASMPETHRAIIDTRPVWATGVFAFAVFGAAFGRLLPLHCFCIGMQNARNSWDELPEQQIFCQQNQSVK